MYTLHTYLFHLLLLIILVIDYWGKQFTLIRNHINITWTLPLIGNNWSTWFSKVKLHQPSLYNFANIYWKFLPPQYGWVASTTHLTCPTSKVWRLAWELWGWDYLILLPPSSTSSCLGLNWVRGTVAKGPKSNFITTKKK